MNPEQVLQDCQTTAGKMESQIERLLDAKKAIEMCFERAKETIDKGKELMEERLRDEEIFIKHLKAVRESRMAISQELTFMRASFQQFDALFNGPNFRKIADSMKEFLDLCERYEKLKGSAEILKGLL